MNKIYKSPSESLACDIVEQIERLKPSKVNNALPSQNILSNQSNYKKIEGFDYKVYQENKTVRFFHFTNGIDGTSCDPGHFIKQNNLENLLVILEEKPKGWGDKYPEDFKKLIKIFIVE